MDAFTAKNWPFNKAPRHLKLLGDKAQKVESASHIIEFPGGAVEVSRCTDGSYWVHAIVNRQQALPDDMDPNTRLAALGEVVDARMDREHPRGVSSVEDMEHIEQFAIRIKPVRR